MLPMVVTLAHALLSSQGAMVPSDNPILLASVGSVLAGAVFGDHCSPISDTTILSSQACACDHIAHVVTQLPYALAMAVLAVVLGTLPVGWGVSVWVLLPVQLIAIYLLLATTGQEVEPQPEAP
jgi:Na+/H+ antiporter NhaC